MTRFVCHSTVSLIIIAACGSLHAQARPTGPRHQPPQSRVDPTIACAAAATGLFGACLDALIGKLGDLIQNAENAGAALEVGLGGQIATNVLLMREEYDFELSKTMQQIGALETNLIQSTMNQLTSLEQHTFRDAQKLTKDILDTADRIPFARRDPAVRPLSNPYYVRQDTGNLHVTIDGHFLDNSEHGYEATIKVDSTNYSAQQTTNNRDQLGFDVPYSQVKSGRVTAILANRGETTKAAYTHITVTIPYKKSGCIFNCKKLAVFKFELVALPDSIGQVTITQHYSEDSTPSAPQVSDEAFQDSKDNDITEDKSGKLTCWAPRNNGWAIRTPSVKGKVIQIVEGEEGTDWWWVANPASETSAANACIRMETLHKKVGHSGKVRFVVEWDEEHHVLQPTQSPNTKTIPAIGSVIFYLDKMHDPHAVGVTWTGSFAQFDGKTYDFDATQPLIGTPFLIVSSLSDHVQVQGPAGPDVLKVHH